ncbi:MAG TPA: Rieske 2Fe-2S domain-containing protein, partial [Candidatus Binatia bacterium]|nr:Rieske 2Fe-2S domain-containing protein [Candidatus Binatia bacterium]
MLTQQDNERLIGICPETPMGRLLRCYWYPIAAASELNRHPTKQVRILGEELVLYRDGRGKLGLIGAYCAHRRAGLVYGIPEPDGLRCPYRGWKYDAEGRCTEQPFEET